eukprot:15336388-Ditylum_brightwellii.AAC.1
MDDRQTYNGLTPLIQSTDTIFYTFAFYIVTLDDWERVLFKDIQMDESVFKIMEVGADPTTIFIVATDGSLMDNENLMVFGWKVSR